MKYLLSSLMLAGIVLLGACGGNEELTVDVVSDKTTLAVGETIEFTIAVSSGDYDCGNWNVRKPDGASIAGETGITASTSHTFSYTATEAGSFTFEYDAGYDCDENRVALGEIGKDIFRGTVDFTVTE